MGRARLILGAWTRAEDPQVTIDLFGIGIDDNAVEPLGQRKRGIRLAAGSRPCNKDGAIIRHGLSPRLFGPCFSTGTMFQQ